MTLLGTIRVWMGKCVLPALAGMLLLNRPMMGQAQTNLNVVDFGAQGDAAQILVNTVSNSNMITVQSANMLSVSDVGKVILLFGVGAPTTPTNNQDLVALILSVTNGTNVTISAPPCLTATQVAATYGTQNAGPFQQCVDACTGTNTVIAIPPGTYLLVPPSQLNTNLYTNDFWNWRTAVVLQKGGIHFLGTGLGSVLMGCGAWTLNAQAVQRGWIFLCKGPVTNDAPLVFENLTFDGGVQQGREAYYNSGPARTTDGAGWDVTHDAVVDGGTPPLHAYKSFVNCQFVHWRGEMVKSVVAGTDGFIEVTNCAFTDGEASGFNFNFTHVITGCTFSNLDMAMEFYAGYMLNSSVFENSVITNVRSGIVLVGALTNHEMPSYTISSNSIAPSQYGVLFGPARNVTVAGNQFFGGIGVANDGAAYQGSGVNSNILVVANTFLGAGLPFNVGGGGEDLIENVVLSNNIALSCKRFADGYGWSSNIFFLGNSSSGFLHGVQLGGQWFVDDPSNDFPYFPVYDGAQTNLITYANGMRQQIFPSQTNSVFLIDDSHPQQIPPGASLIVVNSGKYPVTLFTSSTALSNAPTTVPVGQSVQCSWQSSGWFTGDVTPPLPAAPRNMRVLSTQEQ